ncbi:antibiotic biosynthesis monooxygenase family protein [Microbacterium paludicola]|uniref:hypothetical protein n=1 Tax=Microbacterium paludicola TaxID=300019 RepID=UPI00143086C3|nr:hypothetical protein [Microbacterium paludicola]MBF0817283.1 hypothetical protein [Microbacterium paludicola]
MIRTVLPLRVHPSKVEAVLELYRRKEILQFSADHADLVHTEISVAADGSGDMIVTAVWPSAEAYQGWLDHPWRAEAGDELNELLADAEVGVGRIYVIDHEARPS